MLGMASLRHGEKNPVTASVARQSMSPNPQPWTAALRSQGLTSVMRAEVLAVFELVKRAAVRATGLPALSQP